MATLLVVVVVVVAVIARQMTTKAKYYAIDVVTLLPALVVVSLASAKKLTQSIKISVGGKIERQAVLLRSCSNVFCALRSPESDGRVLNFLPFLIELKDRNRRVSCSLADVFLLGPCTRSLEE